MAVGVAVAVAVGVGVAVGVAVAVAVGVDVAVGVAVAVAVGVGVTVGVRDAVGNGVGRALGVDPGEPSPISWNTPRPWVPAKTTPFRFCSRSTTGTPETRPKFNGAQLDPPSIVTKIPISVAASIVRALGSFRSTSKRETGMSGSAFSGGGV